MRNRAKSQALEPTSPQWTGVAPRERNLPHMSPMDLSLEEPTTWEVLLHVLGGRGENCDFLNAAAWP